MKQKHIYIAAAVAAGALLAWLWRRSTSTTATASVSLGDSFTVNGTTYSTPPDLRTPETGVIVVN